MYCFNTYSSKAQYFATNCSFVSNIAEYTDANSWRYAIRRRVTFASALEFSLICLLHINTIKQLQISSLCLQSHRHHTGYGLVRVLSYATAVNTNVLKYGKTNGPEVPMLYYVEDKRVLGTDSQNWTCNINFLRTLNKSKLENFKITYLQARKPYPKLPLNCQTNMLNPLWTVYGNYYRRNYVSTFTERIHLNSTAMSYLNDWKLSRLSEICKYP